MTENEGEEDDELITWEDLVKCNSFLNNFSCFGKEHLINFCKVGCAIPLVFVSILLHAEFGPNDHWVVALHFISKLCYLRFADWFKTFIDAASRSGIHGNDRFLHSFSPCIPDSVITHKIEVIYHGQFNIHQLGNKFKIIICILSCGLLGLNLKYLAFILLR